MFSTSLTSVNLAFFRFSLKYESSILFILLKAFIPCIHSLLFLSKNLYPKALSMPMPQSLVALPPRPTIKSLIFSCSNDFITSPKP